MQESFTFTEHDAGKRVVDTSGDQLGIVAEVRDGTAYVDSDPSLTDTVMSKLGWAEADADTYPLDATRVEEITEDEIRLSAFETW